MERIDDKQDDKDNTDYPGKTKGNITYFPLPLSCDREERNRRMKKKIRITKIK